MKKLRNKLTRYLRKLKRSLISRLLRNERVFLQVTDGNEPLFELIKRGGDDLTWEVGPISHALMFRSVIACEMNIDDGETDFTELDKMIEDTHPLWRPNPFTPQQDGNYCRSCNTKLPMGLESCWICGASVEL